MAYTIRNADGTVLVNLVDGTIDTRTTSITLIGKNKEDYGTAYNTNLVNMLQNFASAAQPRAPLVGQLWYNKSEGRLKIYTEEGVFKNVSAALVDNVQPFVLKQGDLWIDSVNNQLYFTKDGSNVTLAGPIFSSLTGKSGFLSEIFLDDTGVNRPVTTLYSNGVLLGILSTCSFTIAPTGIVAQNNQGMFAVLPGLNLNPTITDNKFVGIATTASNIGTGFTLTNIFLKLDNANVNQTITGTGALILRTDNGISIGTYTDATWYVTGGIANRRNIFKNNIADATTELVTKTTLLSPPSNEKTVLTAWRDRVGINLGPSTPTHNFHVEGNSFFNGNATITGNLEVQGTQTVVSTVILQIEDKNIELATSATWYTDVLVDGGGLTLHGTTDKLFVYYNSATAWTSNINFNIAGTGTYKVNNFNVLSSSTLGPTVTQSSITKVGVLEELTVTNVLIKGNGISNKTGQHNITSIGATVSTLTSTGSSITVNVSSQIPFLSTGTTVEIDGITQPEYNSVYLVTAVTSATSSSTTFTVNANTSLTTSTGVLGATPIVLLKDLLLHSPTSGNLDVTGQRIKNIAYSTVPTDAASVQLVYDTLNINALKTFSVTIDITHMSNPDLSVAGILENLLPPTNTNFGPYNNESAFDLPLDSRARVLCVTNAVTVRNVPINLVTTSTTVSDWPAGAPINVLQYAAVSSGIVTTSTVATYSVKEFRIQGTISNKYWAWFRNIP